MESYHLKYLSHSCSPDNWKQLQPLLGNKTNMLFLLASHSNQQLETDEEYKPQSSLKKKATIIQFSEIL